MGAWYATALFWKPHVALFVNESTLLPVLMSLAPAATVLERFPAALAELLSAHRVNDGFVEREVAEMSECQLAPTKNRSMVGVMKRLRVSRWRIRSVSGDNGLVALSRWLSGTPCGPLHGRHGSPDRELAALVAQDGS